MPTKPPPHIVVEQVDRDAATTLLRVIDLPFYADEVASGEADHSAAVQAFARHRLTGRDEGMRRAAEIAERWRDENKIAAAKARKSLSEGSRNMAEMLDGAAIECNAIAGEIRSILTETQREEQG